MNLTLNLSFSILVQMEQNEELSLLDLGSKCRSKYKLYRFLETEATYSCYHTSNEASNSLPISYRIRKSYSNWVLVDAYGFALDSKQQGCKN